MVWLFDGWVWGEAQPWETNLNNRLSDFGNQWGWGVWGKNALWQFWTFWKESEPFVDDQNAQFQSKTWSFSNPDQEVLVMKLSAPQPYILQRLMNYSFSKRLNMFNVEIQHIPNVQNWSIHTFRKIKEELFSETGFEGKKKCLPLKCLWNSTFWTFWKPSGIQGQSLAITRRLVSTHIGLTDGQSQGSLPFPCAWAIFNAALHTKTKPKTHIWTACEGWMSLRSGNRPKRVLNNHFFLWVFYFAASMYDSFLVQQLVLCCISNIVLSVVF